MEQISYPAIFFEDAPYIGVEFPDLPGCFSQGDDLSDAEFWAGRAIRCFLDSVEAEDYPLPSKIENINLANHHDIKALKFVDMCPEIDESHQKLYNPQTHRITSVPMQKEVLGDRLQAKILEQAGVKL
ncbi:MAG: type II toxin-antitoxin system HicB family antitoxin [Selenomonadaceae bacterium]|nr:type II toxin-antitoxin system HicB family antitoxin [Selenomonadaceae bacterium]